VRTEDGEWFYGRTCPHNAGVGSSSLPPATFVVCTTRDGHLPALFASLAAATRALGLAAAFGLIAWSGVASVTVGLSLVVVGSAGYALLAWWRVFSLDERRAWTAMLSRARPTR
jgi:hypothetical protein